MALKICQAYWTSMLFYHHFDQGYMISITWHPTSVYSSSHVFTQSHVWDVRIETQCRMHPSMELVSMGSGTGLSIGTIGWICYTFGWGFSIYDDIRKCFIYSINSWACILSYFTFSEFWMKLMYPVKLIKFFSWPIQLNQTWKLSDECPFQTSLNKIHATNFCQGLAIDAILWETSEWRRFTFR